MTALNQKTIRGILARVLSVDASRIVPKQGNWWDPNGRGGRFANWCAYRISSEKPRTAPFYAEIDGTHCAVSLVLSVLELQFVGHDSEELAQSVALWPLRKDVQEEFAAVRGSVLPEELTAYSSPFSQEGGNTETAWNVPGIKILWYNAIETDQTRLQSVEFGGSVTARRI